MMTIKMSADPLNIIGETIDRYMIVDYLATGGTAHIYKARWNEQFVVVKLLREDMLDEPDIRQRLYKEAYALSQLEHPHIIKFFGDGKFQQIPYLVFEYVEIGSLKDYINDAGKFLTPGDATIIIQQIADALHTLHESGFIHRDVKPGNIMLRDKQTAALADFGIVRNEDSQSRYGVQPGTLDFMAPEQLDGVEADFTTDQFALGVVAFWLLTGKRPFIAYNRQEAMRQRQRGVPSAHSINPDLPIELDAVLRRAMHFDMAERYTFIEEFALHITQIINKHQLEDYPLPGTTVPIIINTSDSGTFEKPVLTVSKHPQLMTLMRPYTWISVGILCAMLAVILIYISVPPTQAWLPDTPEDLVQDLIKVTDNRDNFNCADFMYLYNELYTQVNDASPEFADYLRITDESSATKIIYVNHCAVFIENGEDTISHDTWNTMRNELVAIHNN